MKCLGLTTTRREGGAFLTVPPLPDTTGQRFPGRKLMKKITTTTIDNAGARVAGKGAWLGMDQLRSTSEPDDNELVTI